MSRASLAKYRKERKKRNYKPSTRTLVKSEKPEPPISHNLISLDFWKRIGNIKAGVEWIRLLITVMEGKLKIPISLVNYQRSQVNVG